MVEPRKNAQFFKIKSNKVLIFGGYNDGDNKQKTIEIFDEKFGTSKLVYKMPAYYRVKTILLPNEEILLLGGIASLGNWVKRYKNAITFNYINNKFTILDKKLNFYHNLNTKALLLKDKNILIINEWLDNKPYVSEIYMFNDKIER